MSEIDNKDLLMYDEELNRSDRKPILSVNNGAARSDELATPEDFTSPDEIYNILIEKIEKYHPSEDYSMIEKAYHMANEAHKDQKRKAG